MILLPELVCTFAQIPASFIHPPHSVCVLRYIYNLISDFSMLANPCFYDAMRSFFLFFLFNQIGVASWFGNGSGTADNRQKSATFRGWFYSFHQILWVYFREIDYRVNLNRRDILIQFSFFSSKSVLILGGIFIGVQKEGCCSHFPQNLPEAIIYLRDCLPQEKGQHLFYVVARIVQASSKQPFINEVLGWPQCLLPVRGEPQPVA